MEFLYQDARSPSGRFFAHSERRNDSRTGGIVFVLQLIDLSQNTVVQEEVFQDWNTYSQRYDMLTSVILPIK
jgi:hypothetical protein